MKFNLSSIKEWSLKKKIGYGFLTFIILAGIFSGGGKNPDDLLEEMNNSKDKAEILELSKKFKEMAEIKNENFKNCKSNCEGKSTSIQISGLKGSTSKFPFRGKVQGSSSSHGSDLKIWNASYDKNSKITKVTIGSDIKEFTPLELSVTKFNVMGRFVEYHMMNHDVGGMIISYTTDTAKLDKIKKEQERKQKEIAEFNAKFPQKKTLAYYSDGSCRNSSKTKCISKSDLKLICSKKPFITDFAHQKLTLTKARVKQNFLKAGKRSFPVYALSKDGEKCFVQYDVTGMYNGTNHKERVFGYIANFYNYKGNFFAN